MTNKKEHVLEAVFPDEAYQAFKRGDAVDNNGFRSKKGSFWPEQPKFREKTSDSGSVHTIIGDLMADIGKMLIRDVIFPQASIFIREEIYPRLVAKYRARAIKKQGVDPKYDTRDMKKEQSEKIIDLNEYQENRIA